MQRSAEDWFVAATTIFLLVFAAPAKAVPISYKIAGVASGKIGNTSFTNASVTVTLSSDTSTVVANPLVSPDVTAPNTLANRGTATVTISGIGTANVTNAVAIYSTVTPVPQFGSVPYVLIATLDDPPPPSLNNPTAIALIGSNSVAGYDLRTALGPAALPVSIGYPPTDVIGTNLGNLTFTADTVAPPKTQGTFTATPSAAPAATIGPGFTGVWNDPKQARHGIFVEILPPNSFLAWWFTFTPDGTQQSWFGGVGTYSGNTATVPVNLTTGGQWIPNFDVTKTKDNPWGTLTFTFTDCNSGRVDFVSTYPGYGSNHMDLTRVTLPSGLTCP